MGQIRTLALVHAVVMGLAALALASAADAAGDKSAYEQARQKAASNYDAAKNRCDAMTGSAKDVCLVEAKAARTSNAIRSLRGTASASIARRR